jgi:hypothetical protein
MNTKGDAPANPTKDLQGFPQFGLSKREYFAAMAMQGLCAFSIGGHHKTLEILSRDAVDYADALIKALNEGSK